MKNLLVATGFMIVGFFIGVWFQKPALEDESSVPVSRLQLKRTGDLIDRRTSTAKIDSTIADQALTFDDISQQPSVFQQLFTAYQLALNADMAELENYIDLSARSKDPFYNYNLVTAFLERFTMLDPLLAIEYVESNYRLDRNMFIPHIVTSWIRFHPEAAIDYFRTIDSLQMKRTLGMRLLADPTLQRVGLEQEIIQLLGPNSDFIIAQIRSTQLPLEQAFDEIFSTQGNLHSPQLMTVIARWVYRDFDGLVTRISEITNETQRQSLLAQAYNVYASSFPEAALDHVRTYQPDSFFLEEQILGILAYHDPLSARPLIEDYLSRHDSSSLLNNLLSNWVSTNPAQALQYVETLTETQKLNAYQSLATSYMQSHPQEALDWILELDPKYQHVKEMAFSVVTDQNVDFIEQAIDGIRHTGLRQQAFISIAQYKSSIDPQTALDWLVTYEEDPAYLPALQRVLGNWAYRDPAAAAREVEKQLNAEGMMPVIHQIAQSWYSRDEEAAIRWVNSLNDSQARVAALSSLAIQVVYQDPDHAVEMINQLPEGQHQANAKRNIAYTWASQNPDQIDEIIETLDLNEEEADQIRQIIQQTPGIVREFPTH